MWGSPWYNWIMATEQRTPEKYLFHLDANVVGLINDLYAAIGHPEDGPSDGCFDAFEAEIHIILNRFAPKK